METDSGERSIDVISKTAAVISVLERGGECSAQQIAQDTGEPLSSTYRLLSSLISVDIVARGSGRGLFRLGLFPMRIGSMLESQLDIRELGLPIMRTLSQESGATVLLWVRRGDRAACIERVIRADVHTVAVRLGDSLPLWSGAAGRTLLAFLPGSEIADVVDHLRRWSSEPVDLEQDLRDIRAHGFASFESGSTKSTVSIGAPIFNHRGELEAALTLSTLRQWLTDDVADSADRVREAADQISLSLGHRAGATR